MLLIGSLLATVLSFGPCPADNPPADCLMCISNTVPLCIMCDRLRRPSLGPVDGVCTSDRAKIHDACTDTGLYQDFGFCMHCAPGWFLHGYNNVTGAEGGCFRCDHVAAGGIDHCDTCTPGNMNTTINQVVRVICTKCKAGYQLNGDGSACTDVSGEAKCKAGQQKCKTCKSDNSGCATCDDGYGLKSGSCVVCSEKCLLCNNDADTCTSCTQSVLKDGKCVSCDQGENMAGCFSCLSPADTGTSTGRCTLASGSYWVQDDGTTAKCTITNCVRCMNLFGKEYCTTCVNDYFVLDGVCEKYYKLSGEGTKGCSDGVVGMCRSCVGKDVFWFLNTCLTITGTIGKTVCRAMNQTSHICTDCMPGFRATSYGCQQCNVINCQDCSLDLRLCSACLSGYTPITKDGKIVACNKAKTSL
ncbi:High cysteine protein [Giardia duodenalis]|uniref:High cysteine protein n=1 Tax=Giardia intestinalis (strain ATCC 50803 / WB clone C6) TaxID=184922 RepID=A8BFL9_GIAIC|nr:High cysteine protein [Giardia intestinalis]KAE8303415.1 High cysteine protein [Giardia intestinalis]|eukprot:XP_001707295.1 Variant-specific surface protein [Giardia lamblia ATCC 50803]